MLKRFFSGVTLLIYFYILHKRNEIMFLKYKNAINEVFLGYGLRKALKQV